MKGGERKGGKRKEDRKIGTNSGHLKSFDVKIKLDMELSEWSIVCQYE